MRIIKEQPSNIKTIIPDSSDRWRQKYRRGFEKKHGNYYLLQRSKQRCHTRLPSACAYSRTRSCSFQSPLHCVGCRVMSCYFSCSLFPASCTTMDFCLYSAPLLSYVTLIPPLQPSPLCLLFSSSGLCWPCLICVHMFTYICIYGWYMFAYILDIFPYIYTLTYFHMCRHMSTYFDICQIVSAYFLGCYRCNQNDFTGRPKIE